jgi:hypothetical protein
VFANLEGESLNLLFTALASEERGNVIARVCMFVCPCVSPKCATNINSPRRCGTMGFYLAVSHLVVLDVTMVRDDSNVVIRSVTSCQTSCLHIVLDITMVRNDSNLLYNDISRGDELKPN